jgi:hypothetical protein
LREIKNMSQKNLAGIASAVILFFCLSCSNSKHSKSILPGTWQSQPIVIDGDSKDWPSPYPNYDSKAMVAYATSNDRENLYITMETGDQLTQLKILKQGMTVSIDTSGKKDPEFNINYPLQNDNDPLEMVSQAGGLKKNGSSNHDMENLQMEKKIDKNADEDNQFALAGFISCDGGFFITQTTPCGIKIRMKMDEYKELVWEAAIPFKAIYGKNEITATDAGKPLSVCFAVKSFKRPESKGSVENSNGGMNQSMGGGGMKSGSKGGGGTRAQEDPMAHLYENTKTWKQFGIVFQ